MTEVEEILAEQSKTVKEALAKIDARYYVRGKLKDEKQRSSLLKEYNSVLDSYLSGIIIADGRIPDFITQQYEARKAQIVSEAKRAILKALTTAPPRGLPPIPGATAMKNITAKLESEMLSVATYYTERLNALISQTKLSEDGIPLYLYLASGSGNICDVCAASNLKVYEETDIDFTLPRHPNCMCVLVPLTEDVDLVLDEYHIASEKEQTDAALDKAQELLDLLGSIPILGALDGYNAIISLVRGNPLEAGLSVAALGLGGVGGKHISEATENIDEAVDAASKAGKEAAQRADEAIENADDALRHLDEAGDTLVKAAKSATQGVSQKKFNDIVQSALREATAGKTFLGGRAGEEILEKVLGGIPQKQYKTSESYRYVDLFSDGVIHESKVGYKALTESLKMQALKDSLIISKYKNKAVWHFFRSEITGLIGADERLLAVLKDLDIDVIIHW